jgi:hypothetical protein
MINRRSQRAGVSSVGPRIGSVLEADFGVLSPVSGLAVSVFGTAKLLASMLSRNSTVEK